MTYAVLDDQSSDVFLTDPLLKKLNITGQEVNLQVSTIVGTNTVRTRRVSGLQFQDVNGKHSPVKVPCAYAQECIPAMHYDIATPEIARQWEHLKVIADKIHFNPNVDIGILIGRNVPAAFQPLSIIHGEADEPWAEEYKFGWTIIGLVCLDATGSRKSTLIASVNRISVKREELPTYVPEEETTLHAFNTVNQQEPVALLTSKVRFKDVTSPHRIREMMELDYNELHHNRKPLRTEQAGSIEDKRFRHILSTETHQNEEGRWEAPLPFKTDEVILPNNREQCFKRLLSLKKKLLKDHTARKNYVDFIQKIIDRHHASRVPADQLQTSPGKVWYLQHCDIYHPKKPYQVRVVFDCSAVFKDDSLNNHLIQGPDQMNSLIGVLLRFHKDYVAFTCDIEQMFHNFHVSPEHRDFLRFLWFEDNDLNGRIVEFRMNVHLFGAKSSPAVANFCLHKTAGVGRSKFGSDAADFLCQDFYVDDGLKSVPSALEAVKLIESSQAMCAAAKLRLHKFACNQKEVLEALSTDYRAGDLKDLDLRSTTGSTMYYQFKGL